MASVTNKTPLGFNMETVTTLREMAKGLEMSETAMNSAIKRLEDRFEENKSGLGKFEKKISGMISDLSELQKEVQQRSIYTREKVQNTASRIQQFIIKNT